MLVKNADHDEGLTFFITVNVRHRRDQVSGQIFQEPLVESKRKSLGGTLTSMKRDDVGEE